MGIKKFFGDILFGDKAQYYSTPCFKKNVVLSGASAWHRIAEAKIGAFKASAQFDIVQGQNSFSFRASCVYGTSPEITQLEHSRFNTLDGLQKARIVYKTPYSATDKCYLEVYNYSGASTDWETRITLVNPQG